MDSLLLNSILYPAICGRENHYSHGHYFHVKDKTLKYLLSQNPSFMKIIYPFIYYIFGQRNVLLRATDPLSDVCL